MDVLFDDRVFVHYGFLYLTPEDEEDPDFDDSRRGQRNGLLGAAVPGSLMMLTGTHTGRVAVRLEWHDVEPPLAGPEWANIVEASLVVLGSGMTLSAFSDFHEVEVPRSGSHRARYSAAGMADGTEDDVGEGEEPRDRYLLQLWPAPPSGDRIVRVGSDRARYWHDEVPSMRAEPDVVEPDVVEPAADTGYRRWEPSVQRDESFADALRSFPMSLQVMVTAATAKVVCRRIGVDHVPIVAAHLQELQMFAPLPAGWGDVDQLTELLRREARQADVAAASTVALVTAARALALASDSSLGMQPHIAFDNALPVYDGDREALFRDICDELGYPYRAV